MLKNLSFRSRLLLSFWGVLLLALLLPSLYFRQTLSEDIEADTRSRAIRQLSFAYWLVSQEQPFSDAASLQEWCESVGEHLGIRITFVAAGGTVIADSQVPFYRVPQMDNHANRPEIIQACKQEVGTSTRYSTTLEKHLIYAAKRIDRRGSIPTGVIRVAVPFSEVKSRLDRLTKDFVLIVLATLLATILISYPLVRQLEAPIRGMISAAEAIGSGDYGQRIWAYPGQEFSPLAQAINQMAESIETHIQTITEQKEQLQAILNGMSEGVMVLDVKGKIQTINPALEKLVTHPPASIGRRPLEVMRSAELQEACDQVLADSDKPQTQPHNLEINLEEARVFNVNIVRLHDQRAGIGAIVVFHDISQLKRLEKVRQDFVANVSHELRTPLTSIKGYTETLLAEAHDNSDTSRSFLQIIQKHADHMNKMVDDLLQLARLDARQRLPDAVSINAADTLHSAWKSCGSIASEKNISLENFLSPDGVFVQADSEQLIQVFRNLLENGIRYSPAEGSLSVSCNLRSDLAIFQVRDEGPGIPRQDQQRIFERFYRVERDRSDQTGSTGLGLAICRHIIQNHGGQIWVESPPQGETKGSAFFFSLPLTHE
ncbi:MAG: HAMP domain-containing protein [Deltaproteobacteria bacterium]|nr:MAG: HAMP domain-containing protein [Deltaproteobacteria bacterium]